MSANRLEFSPPWTDGFELEKEEPGIFGFHVPATMSLKRNNDSIAASVEGSEQKTVFKAQVIEKIRSEYPLLDRLSCLMTQKYTVICPYDSFGLKHPVVCLNSRTGEVLWQADVWDSGLFDRDRRPKDKGLGEYQLTIVVTEKSVGLFGCMTGENTLDIRDIASGQRICRFSTNNLRTDHVTDK